MLALLRAASGKGSFAEWSKEAERVGSARSERLEGYLEVLYTLLEDIILTQHGHDDKLRNPDIRPELASLASAVDFPWIRKMLGRADELSDLLRRNIQKGIALDALVADLRPQVSAR
jgi:DNA polymerase-3 subunit delta'